MKQIFSTFLVILSISFIAIMSYSCGDDMSSSDKYNSLHSDDAIELEDAIIYTDISKKEPLYDDSSEEQYDPNLDGKDRLDPKANSHFTHGSGGREGSDRGFGAGFWKLCAIRNDKRKSLDNDIKDCQYLQEIRK